MGRVSDQERGTVLHCPHSSINGARQNRNLHRSIISVRHIERLRDSTTVALPRSLFKTL